MLIAGVAWLGGCATPRPIILSGPDPADPGIVAPLADAAPVTAGNGVGFPVAPLPWVAVNHSVAIGAGRAP
jgi:hypothetical protein